MNARAWMIGTLLIAGTTCTAAAEAVLKPPQGYLSSVKIKKRPGEPCDAPPAPFTATLDFPSKYEGSGEGRDQLNAQSNALYEQLTLPITSMERGFSRHVGKYMDEGDPVQLDCSLQWIDSWASAGALQGEATNHTGRSLRKWALGSLSGSWLRLKFSASAPLKNSGPQAARIEAWLGEVANRVAREWLPNDPLNKVNNHYYWAAWALMATSVATNRRELFDQSVQLYRVFVHQADAEGYLPNELARKSQAAEYHAYSMLPLSMIAAFGKANGVDLAAEGDGALSRLAKRAQAALEDPASFQALAGVVQNSPDAASKTNWSWVEPYCWTVKCPAPLLARRLAMSPLGTTRLGGNLSTVFSGFKEYPLPPTVLEPKGEQ